MLAALGSAWEGTFSNVKAINHNFANEIADKFSSKFDLPHFAPPSSTLVEHHLHYVPNSGPGPLTQTLDPGPGPRTRAQLALGLARADLPVCASARSRALWSS